MWRWVDTFAITIINDRLGVKYPVKKTSVNEQAHSVQGVCRRYAKFIWLFVEYRRLCLRLIFIIK